MICPECGKDKTRFVKWTCNICYQRRYLKQMREWNIKRKYKITPPPAKQESTPFFYNDKQIYNNIINLFTQKTKEKCLNVRIKWDYYYLPFETLSEPRRYNTFKHNEWKINMKYYEFIKNNIKLFDILQVNNKNYGNPPCYTS
jgi:hypothetical protein